MKEIWQEIEQALTEIAPAVLNSLNGGATAAEIAKIEKLIGAKLPEDFVSFYKIHNGQADGPGMLYGEEFLSVKRIQDEWYIWKKLLDDGTFEDAESDPDLGIKADWWNARWIPFSYDGSGNHFCLDLDPDSGGNYGQVIRMWHDDEVRALKANSFTEWVTIYTDKLTSGQLVYSEDRYGIVAKSEFADEEYCLEDGDSDE